MKNKLTQLSAYFLIAVAAMLTGCGGGSDGKDVNCTLNLTTLAGSGTAGAVDATGTAASFNYPIGVAVDAAGNVYVGDRNNQKIRKITLAGVVTTLAGSGAEGAVDATGTAASFNMPRGVAVDAAGNVYVADSINNKIRKIIP